MKDEDGKVLEEGDEVSYALHDGSFHPDERTGVISRITEKEACADEQEGAYCVRATGKTLKELTEHGISCHVTITSGGFVMLKLTKKARTSKDVDAGSYDDVYNEKVGRQLEESLNEVLVCDGCKHPLNKHETDKDGNLCRGGEEGSPDCPCNLKQKQNRAQELKELREDLDILFEEIRKVEKRIIALEGD